RAGRRLRAGGLDVPDRALLCAAVAAAGAGRDAGLGPRALPAAGDGRMGPILRRGSRMWARWPFPLGPAVAVIGYHRVDDVDHHLAVSTRGFPTHVAVLAGQRASQPVLDLDEALDRLDDGTAPRRAVVVTFDDAWADYHANALGPLVEHAIPSTMYVPSRRLDRPGHPHRAR